tara:strand:+ start:155 stop:505 length:351 start_codon:yes stop_codon:yes gene_type:complete
MDDQEDDEGCCCVFCCGSLLFVGFIALNVGQTAFLEFLALIVTIVISVYCLITLFFFLRERCLYWRLRYEIRELDRYIQRRTNVTIVPVDPPPVETVIVIQNPNDISLGYISKDKA